MQPAIPDWLQDLRCPDGDATNRAEIEGLYQSLNQMVPGLTAEQRERLKQLHAQRSDIERERRGCEQANDFGERFIELVRARRRVEEERIEVQREIESQVPGASCLGRVKKAACV